MYGVEIDVKTTTCPTGRVLVSPRKRELAHDCYALMLCDWPRFTFAGFAPSAELFKAERVTDVRGEETYAISQHDMKLSLVKGNRDD